MTTEKTLIDISNLETIVKEILEKSREDDKGLVGAYNGAFPLTSASQGSIYLLPSNRKLYICTKHYSGSKITVPNSNFEELSIYKNRNRLENLSRKDLSNDLKVLELNGLKFIFGKFHVMTNGDKIQYKLSYLNLNRIYLAIGGTHHTGTERVRATEVAADTNVVYIKVGQTPSDYNFMADGSFLIIAS